MTPSGLLTPSFNANCFALSTCNLLAWNSPEQSVDLLTLLVFSNSSSEAGESLSDDKAICESWHDCSECVLVSLSFSLRVTLASVVDLCNSVTLPEGPAPVLEGICPEK